jgi:hypothetical protein
MVDPSALYAGPLAVYGQQEMDRNYGQLVPVEASRVVASTDGGSVALAGRPLLTLDDPGPREAPPPASGTPPRAAGSRVTPSA